MSEPDYTTEVESDPQIVARDSGRRIVIAGIGVLLAVMGGLWWRFGESATPMPVEKVAFEMRLAETTPAPGLTAATVSTNPQQTVYLHSEPIVTNADLTSADVGEENGEPTVGFTVGRVGAARLRQATAGHRGKPIAILVDGEVRMAPTVRSTIGGRGMISGGFTPIEAERIVNGILE